MLKKMFFRDKNRKTAGNWNSDFFNKKNTNLSQIVATLCSEIKNRVSKGDVFHERI